MAKFIEAKKRLIELFKKNNIDLQEVNILFCEVLNCTQADLLTKVDLSVAEQKKLNYAVKKRLEGMPIQKIFRRAYFYDLVLYINNNVLCPRPETELLVEEVLKTSNGKSKILDLCTGSGAIALAIKKHTNAQVFASDISTKALYVAKKNAKNLNLQLKFIHSNMFDGIKQKFDIIVSNPPYIKTEDCKTLDVEVKNYDPIISLDGGANGLKFYEIIAKDAPKHLTKNGKIVLEVGMGQAQAVKKLLEKNGFVCYIKRDYNNIERVVVGELKWLKNVIQ